MKILFCHNYYQQRGGEDISFESEVAMLRRHRHEVRTYTRHNDDVPRVGRFKAATDGIWSRRTYREITRHIEEFQPDIVHCNNTFPLISPAVHHAAKKKGVATVQALRNYRPLCINATFCREGQVCTSCLGKSLPLAGIRRKCYRDSRIGSAAVTLANTLHKATRTWARKVDVFFTPSEFARNVFVQGGFDPERVLVKPNFLQDDPGPGPGDGGYALFVGRLSAEKGIATMLESWRRLDIGLPLRIVGTGDPAQCALVSEAARADSRIQWLGSLPHAGAVEQMGRARFLVIPSIWFETFGRGIVEAFACGTPVIASRLGAMSELVTEGKNGFLFTPGDPADLVAKIERFVSVETPSEMRGAARAEFVAKYAESENHARLMQIYERALWPGTTAAPLSSDEPALLEVLRRPAQLPTDKHFPSEALVLPPVETNLVEKG